MIRRKNLHRKKYSILILFILTCNIVAIIFLPHNNLGLKNSENVVDDPNSLIQMSSIGPLNKHFFKYYKVITINHSSVSGTESHKNFPLLISILDLDLFFG